MALQPVAVASTGQTLDHGDEPGLHLVDERGLVPALAEPEEQARFEALHDAVAGMSLADAERTIGEGGVIDKATGEPVPWRPAPMVVPVSGRLQVLVTGPSYERALAVARGGVRFGRVTA